MEVQTTFRMGRYGYYEHGFLRLSCFGWRLVFINTAKHRPLFSDRKFGWRVGRFIISLKKYGV
jgi:hypothetical protein